MYYETVEMLNKLKRLAEEYEAICVEGEAKGFKVYYCEGDLHCREPDGLGYACTENSIPIDLMWIIVEA